MFSALLALSLIHAPVPPCKPCACVKEPEVVKSKQDLELELCVADILSRFPSHETARDWCQWSKEYQKWIEGQILLQMTVEEKNAWTEYLWWVKKQTECWNVLSCATSYAHAYPALALQELKELEEKLGPEDFFLGYIHPPVVPECLWVIE